MLTKGDVLALLGDADAAAAVAALGKKSSPSELDVVSASNVVTASQPQKPSTATW